MIFITERVPFTKDDLADEFDLEISTIELALKAFVELDMIELSDDGFISVINWEKYQSTDKLAEIREKDRERKRLKRAQAKALLEESKDVQGQSKDSPYIEEEKDKDKEKEYHSFNLSAREEEKMTYMRGKLGEGVVLMSEEQFHDLLDKLSLDELEKYMGIIVECERNGKRYKKKSHYQAILEMAAKDRRLSDVMGNKKG